MPVRFSTLPAAVLSVEDFRSRCAAAAKLAMRGANYDAEDRADCAAKIAADILGNGYSWTTGTPRDVLRFIDWGFSHPATVAAMLAEDLAALPSSAASFSRLYGMAANYRRALDRTRARDAADAARRAETEAFTPHVPAEDPATRGTPWGARRTAVEMLRALGMLGRVVESGPVWTAAYAAARSASGMDAPEIAAELDLSYDTYRAHLSRAAKRFPSAAVLPMLAHADLLPMPEHAPGRKLTEPLLGKTGTSGARDDWRTHPAAPAPLVLRAGDDETSPYRHTVSALRTARAIEPPHWTRDLRPNTAARLAHAAKIKRARMDAKTDAEHARDRLAAGIPATVR